MMADSSQTGDKPHVYITLILFLSSEIRRESFTRSLHNVVCTVAYQSAGLPLRSLCCTIFKSVEHTSSYTLLFIVVANCLLRQMYSRFFALDFSWFSLLTFAFFAPAEPSS